MEENNDWATETLKEAPFWRDGMTPEEYDEEREYLGKNYILLQKRNICSALEAERGQV